MGKRVGTAKWMEKQNRWQIKVQRDGERRTFTSSKPGRTGQREANAKADAWLDEGIENANKRISALLEEYIEDLKARTSQSNWRNEEARVRNWIKPVIGNIKATQINDQLLQKIINNAYKNGNLSKKSLTNLRAALFGFCKFCRKSKVTTFHPEDIVIPVGARAKKKKILQPDDLITLFTVDTTTYRGETIFEPYIYAYRFQALTGLRPGEIIGLRKTDINDNVVKLQRSINIYGEVTQGKNKNAQRPLAMFSLAKQILEQQLKISTTDSVFEILSEHNYRQRWKKYCETNSISYITPYELRHTFVSIAQNLPEGQLKRVIGHSESMDTYGVYAHEIQGDLEQTAINLENIFSTLLLDGEK